MSQKTYPYLVYIMAGLPASGKTTHRDKLCATLQMMGTQPIITSSDDFLDRMAIGQDITYNEAFKDYMPVADEAFWATLRLAVGMKTPTIIVDRTNMTAKSRKRIIDAVKSVPGGEEYKFVIAECRASDEDIAARNETRSFYGKKIPQNVIDSMKKSYEQPTKDEHPDIVIWTYYDTSVHKYVHEDFTTGEIIERSVEDLERK